MECLHDISNLALYNKGFSEVSLANSNFCCNIFVIKQPYLFISNNQLRLSTIMSLTHWRIDYPGEVLCHTPGPYSSTLCKLLSQLCVSSQSQTFPTQHGKEAQTVFLPFVLRNILRNTNACKSFTVTFLF